MRTHHHHAHAHTHPYTHTVPPPPPPTLIMITTHTHTHIPGKNDKLVDCGFAGIHPDTCTKTFGCCHDASAPIPSGSGCFVKMNFNEKFSVYPSIRPGNSSPQPCPDHKAHLDLNPDPDPYPDTHSHLDPNIHSSPSPSPQARWCKAEKHSPVPPRSTSTPLPVTTSGSPKTRSWRTPR